MLNNLYRLSVMRCFGFEHTKCTNFILEVNVYKVSLPMKTSRSVKYLGACDSEWQSIIFDSENKKFKGNVKHDRITHTHTIFCILFTV